MVEMKAVSNWSMADFDSIDTVEDLIWWHGETIKKHSLINGVS